MRWRALPVMAAFALAALLGVAGAAVAATPPAPNATSAVNAASNDACLGCHGQHGKTPPIVVNGQRVSTYVDRAAYEGSLHGKLACTSCHVGFQPDVHGAGETAGWLEAAKLTACGYCHADQFAMYRGSFHGSLVFGEHSSKAPVCADCHLAHNTLATNTAAFRQGEVELCRRCHPDAVKTYLDGYHGKALYLGRLDAAVCTDCHGSHRILAPSNPASTISRQHIIATCAKCHTGANRNFASFLVHVDPRSPRSSIWVWGVNVLYLMLIAVVFTFGFVHSSLYIYRGIKDGLYSRHRGA